MSLKLKSRIALAAATMVCSMAAQAANTIAFDPFGTGGTHSSLPGGLIIDSVDWLPDNALAIGSLSTPALGTTTFTTLGLTPVAGQKVGENYFRTVAQGKMSTVNDTTIGAFSVLPFAVGREFTFQTSFYEFGSSIGTATASFRLAPGANFFRIFADTTANSDTTTGAGYGNGTLILEGSLTQVVGNFTTNTLLPAGQPGSGQIADLDSFGTDQQSGVRSVLGGGNNKLTVDISLLHKDYFLGDLASLILTLDYFDNTNLAAPFQQVNPSDAVVGVTPVYSLVGGSKVNGLACPTGAGQTEAGVAVDRCDFHFQSDASGSFVTHETPEPGSLALIGLALAGVGVMTRRRKA